MNLRDTPKIWTLNFYLRGYHISSFKSHPTTILTLGARRKVQDKKAGFVDHLPIQDAFPLAWKGTAWEFCCLPVWISICTTTLPMAAKEFSPALNGLDLVEDKTIKTFRLNMCFVISNCEWNSK